MRVLFLALVPLVGAACYTGVIQVEPTAAPFRFKRDGDAATIERVLVLPLYRFDSVSGLSYRIEHLREAISGQPLRFYLPTSTGAEVGHVLVGSAATLEALLVIAPGYRPAWVDPAVFYSQSPEVRLAQASEKEWGEVASLLLGVCQKFHARVDLSALWYPDVSAVVLFRLTKQEKALITALLSEASRT